jgi:hypothetical protein
METATLRRPAGRGVPPVTGAPTAQSEEPADKAGCDIYYSNQANYEEDVARKIERPIGR